MGLRGAEGVPPTWVCEVEAGENISPRLESAWVSLAEGSGSRILLALSGVRSTGSTTVLWDRYERVVSV
jgi:hypothetical protein